MKHKIFGVSLIILTIAMWGFDAHNAWLLLQAHQGEHIIIIPVITILAFWPLYFGIRNLRAKRSR